MDSKTPTIGKVVLFGASGLLGKELTRILTQRGYEILAPTHANVDIGNFKTLLDFFDAHPQPLAVINAAALVNVDAVEKNPNDAQKINTDGAGNIARVLLLKGFKDTRLIHLSTNYVFGDKYPSYTESSTPSPINVYGETKARGESEVSRISMQGGFPYYIIRTSWLYSEFKDTFVDLVAKSLLQGEPVQASVEYLGNPTSGRDCAQGIVERFLDKTPASGVYHLVNESEKGVSRYDIALEIARVLSVSPDLARASLDTSIFEAPRPRTAVLFNTKLPPLPGWRVSLREYILMKHKKMKKALITGITGQDGSYLTEFLISKGYEVHGIVRRSSTFNRHNIDHIFTTTSGRLEHLHYGDMSDMNSLMSILKKVQPDEIYNLAAQSHVKISFEVPSYTAQADALGVLSLLEAVRLLGLTSKIYQASTSELYSGEKEYAPQNEQTPFAPRSPYGVAKLYAFQIARVYRESYGMFVVNGILFNHESPRRGINFVSRKIVHGVAEIAAGSRDYIELGNLDAGRDWGYAPEYMEAAWMMLQRDTPEDFVIATGETHTVREFAEAAFAHIGVKLVWKGTGAEEVGIDQSNGKVLVKIDPAYYRPNEVDYLRGDASRATTVLGWKPKTTFLKLVEIMMESELKRVQIQKPKIEKPNPQIGVGCLEILETDKRYVNEVLESGRLSYGPFIKRFEQEFARAHDARFAIMVNSGTSALEIAVACLKEEHSWQDGDEILCPAVTFVASSNVILSNNLRPVFVDVDRHTYNIDWTKIEERITPRTRAIMAVHLFGQPAAMDRIQEIARAHNLRLIEDSCETMFAKYKGTSVGVMSDIACFSTYVAHILVTGVGGLAVTNNPSLAEKLRSLANHGRDNIYISIDDAQGAEGQELKEIISRRFNFIRRGYSYRVTEMEGALGCAQLERHEETIRKRKENGAYFNRELAILSDHLQLPEVTPDVDHVFMMYPIVIKESSPVKKAELVQYLEEHHIETRDMLPLINQPFYVKMFGNLEAEYPVAQWINEKGFYIASHQMLTEEERRHIVRTFKEFFASRK
jgi:GDP-mannose 4,6-dehydratase/dTDP-4-dehydrorhamnose reductase